VPRAHAYWLAKRANSGCEGTPSTWSKGLPRRSGPPEA
jgi:hypothetical protein